MSKKLPVEVTEEDVQELLNDVTTSVDNSSFRSINLQLQRVEKAGVVSYLMINSFTTVEEDGVSSTRIDCRAGEGCMSIEELM